MSIHTTVHESIDQLNSHEWNNLGMEFNPFLRHEFLAALEHHDCVGERYGWLPHHIVAYDDNRIIGALPLYLKHNSYGEFVFDQDWADAYYRSGLNYYPKLVAAIPYTPVTGPRLLYATHIDRDRVHKTLVDAALGLAEKLQTSSLHCLFTNENDMHQLQTAGLLRRIGYQFHWDNRDYTSFDDFLQSLSAVKRKKIKRERRHVKESGIRFEIFQGNTMTEKLWEIFHGYYTSTFYRLGGHATLSKGFFQELGENMPENVVVIFAFEGARPIASAFCLRGNNTLYGRHWGCEHDINSLHFETCYYQGINYCIQNGLKHFESGAQGEHKISRGFLPRLTQSYHWIAHPKFREIIQEFLHRETQGIQWHMQQLERRSPYKQC